jgi:hypothetical protein
MGGGEMGVGNGEMGDVGKWVVGKWVPLLLFSSSPPPFILQSLEYLHFTKKVFFRVE